MNLTTGIDSYLPYIFLEAQSCSNECSAPIPYCFGEVLMLHALTLATHKYTVMRQSLPFVDVVTKPMPHTGEHSSTCGRHLGAADVTMARNLVAGEPH